MRYVHSTFKAHSTLLATFIAKWRDELAAVLTQEGAEPDEDVCDWHGQRQRQHSWVDCDGGGRRCIHCKREEHAAPAEPRAAEGAGMDDVVRPLSGPDDLTFSGEPQTLEELRAELEPAESAGTGDMDKAMAALDALSEIWAARVNVDHIAKAICGPPDRVERVKAMLKQAYLEGAYDGRTSHIDYPVSKPTAAAAVPAGGDAGWILDEFDSILETIACNDPGLSVRAHKLREPIRKILDAPAPRGGVTEAQAVVLKQGPLAVFVGNANGRGLIRIETDASAPIAGVQVCSLTRDKEAWATALVDGFNALALSTPPAAQAQDAGPMARHFVAAIKDIRDETRNSPNCDIEIVLSQVEQRARALAAKEAK